MHKKCRFPKYLKSSSNSKQGGEVPQNSSYVYNSVITVFYSKLVIILYTLFVQSCQTKLTRLYPTVSTFALCYTKFTLLI